MCKKARRRKKKGKMFYLNNMLSTTVCG